MQEQTEEKTQEVNLELNAQEENEQSPPDDLTSKASELDALVNDLKDQLLRTLADSENAKKRYEREVVDAKKFAVSSILKDLVDVVENLFRATSHITEDDKQDEKILKIFEGVNLTRQNFIKTLEKYGVTRINPQIADKFDPSLHEAVSQIKHPTQEPGSIADVIQAGYTLNERLIRPAMVVVCAAG